MVYADYGQTGRARFRKIEAEENGGVIICDPRADSGSKASFITDFAVPTCAQSKSEAHRTAFNMLLKSIGDRKAIVLHYTDAFPHNMQVRKKGESENDDAKAEKKNLRQRNMITSWKRLAGAVRGRYRVVTMVMNNNFKSLLTVKTSPFSTPLPGLVVRLAWDSR